MSLDKIKVLPLPNLKSSRQFVIEGGAKIAFTTSIVKKHFCGFVKVNESIKTHDIFAVDFKKQVVFICKIFILRMNTCIK